MGAPVMVDRGGFSIAAYVDGQGEGAPWIILSNSLGAAAMMWEPQLPLLGKRYRVLRYDTRGHGASGAPPEPYSFSDLTADVLALMDRFGIGKASYMGLSLGGMTGLGLAIHHGQRFDRMVICDARAASPEAFRSMWDERLAAVAKGGLAAVVNGTMERWFVEAWRKAHSEMLKRFENAFLATSLEGFRGCVAAIKGLDYAKDLGRISIPVLYVVGSEDIGAPPEAMRAMAAATPGSAFAEVPKAAHLPNVDNTEAFHAAIAAFLGLP
ncbi:MAG TPA: 3-oxoadipate enol-lactonase [Hyphomicrobiales bacterium]|nr:3-oxoadipate enol-lactonase [Hyphomicrobiales bacterium]